MWGTMVIPKEFTADMKVLLRYICVLFDRVVNKENLFQTRQSFALPLAYLANPCNVFDSRFQDTFCESFSLHPLSYMKLRPGVSILSMRFREGLSHNPLLHLVWHLVWAVDTSTFSFLCSLTFSWIFLMHSDRTTQTLSLFYLLLKIIEAPGFAPSNS